MIVEFPPSLGNASPIRPCDWLETGDLLLGVPDTLLPLHSTLRERRSRKSTSGFQIGREFLLGGSQLAACLGSEPRVVRSGNSKRPEVRHDKALDMLIQERKRNMGGARTRPAGVPTMARIVLDLRPATPRAAHRVPARLAPNQTSQQRRCSICASRPSATLRLSGLPLLLSNKRRMRLKVDVGPLTELPEVHTVLHHLPHAARSHSEPVRDLDHGCVDRKVTERLDNKLGVRVRNQTPGVGITRIPFGCLPGFPDAPLGSGLHLLLERFGSLLALVAVDRREQVAMQPASRGGGVDAFTDREDLASGVLDAFPRFEQHTHVTAHAGQVRDHKAVVGAVLDTEDGFVQGGSLLEGQPAAHVKLRRKQMDCVTARCDGVLDGLCLVGNGAEAVAFGVAPSDVRDSQNPDPVHGTGSYRANATPGTRERVSLVRWENG